MEIVEYSLTIPGVANTQAVSISTTSAQSAAVNSPNAVLYATNDCFVIVGDSPTATTSCMPLPAGVMWRAKGWQPGQKIAAITASGSGTLYITPDA